MSAQPPEMMGIAELAARAGVTPRTVRYYVSEGLLPRPEGAGQQRMYGAEHLRYLQAIARLKEAYLPLAEIRRRLAELPPAALDQLAEAPAAPSSALEYLAAIRAPERAAQERGSGSSAPAQPVALFGPPRATRSVPGSGPITGFAASAPTSGEEVWVRVTLAPGVELHYQPTGERRRDEAIAHVIRAAKQAFEPGTSGRSP